MRGPDRRHRAGTPLAYKIAVLPGSFVFSTYGGVIRGHIDDSDTAEPGLHQLSVMLVYDYQPYPSASAPIYSTQPLEFVE